MSKLKEQTKEILHKYIGSLIWVIRNKKRCGGNGIRFTDEGWVICLEPIILSTNKEDN